MQNACIRRRLGFVDRSLNSAHKTSRRTQLHHGVHKYAILQTNRDAQRADWLVEARNAPAECCRGPLATACHLESLSTTMTALSTAKIGPRESRREVSFRGLQCILRKDVRVALCSRVPLACGLEVLPVYTCRSNPETKCTRHWRVDNRNLPNSNVRALDLALPSIPCRRERHTFAS
jgi:uncharacterized protein YecT (DUF1311 family)